MVKQYKGHQKVDPWVKMMPWSQYMTIKDSTSLDLRYVLIHIMHHFILIRSTNIIKKDPVLSTKSRHLIKQGQRPAKLAL